MRIYISTDIEGIGCVVRSEQSSVTGREYAAARRLMTWEVNAAIESAFDTGATAVTVADSHNVGLNLMAEEIDERAELILGGPRPLAMMEGVDGGYDAAFFIGYHARAGTPDSPIVHIFHGRIAEISFNGTAIGEIGLNALLAGYFNVPVALVTGDEATAAETQDLLEDVVTVPVKRGIGAYAAHCLHPKVSRERIYAAAKKAMGRISGLKPYRIEGPVTLKLRCTTASGADRMLRMPGTTRVDGTTVAWEGADVLQAFKAFNTFADLVELTHFI